MALRIPGPDVSWSTVSARVYPNILLAWRSLGDLAREVRARAEPAAGDWIVSPSDPERLGRQAGLIYFVCMLANVTWLFVGDWTGPLEFAGFFVLMATAGTAAAWEVRTALIAARNTSSEDGDISAVVVREQVRLLGLVVWGMPLLGVLVAMNEVSVQTMSMLALAFLAVVPTDIQAELARRRAQAGLVDDEISETGEVARMRTLRNVQILRRWGTLLLGCNGEEEGFWRGVEAQLAALNPPGVRWQRTSVAPGILKGLLGKRRDFIFVRSSQLRDYQIYICGRSYGTSLDVSWYLVLGTHGIIAAVLGMIPMVYWFVAAWLLRKRLDVFDQQDLDAYEAVCEMAVRQAVKDLLAKKSLEQEIDWKVQDMVRVG